MKNFYLVYLAFLKISLEMIGTFLIAFVVLVVREIYQLIKNRKRVTYGN
jgi:hypothetical protein